MADKEKRVPFSGLIKQSFILTALSHLTDQIYEDASHSLTGGILTSRDRLISASKKSLAAAAASKISAGNRIIRPLKRACIKSFENSGILGWINARLRGLLGCPIRHFGIFLLSFGLYSASVFAVKYYADIAADTADIILCLAAAAFAVPMMMSSMTLSQIICGSGILSRLLFSVIGARRENIENASGIQGRAGIAFVFGMVLGIATYAASPGLILAGIFGLIVLYTILIIPESGVLLIIFAAPFMSVLPRPSIMTAVIVVYVTGCYFLKLIRGKRTFRFEPVDGAVALFLVLTLLGGVFTVSVSASLEYALIYGCFTVSYFLIVNLMRTVEWVKRCVAAFICSSAIVSLYGIYQNILGTASTKWQDVEMFGDLGGRVVSTFENPNVLAEYLIMTIPFAVAVMLTRRGWLSRGGMFAVCGSAAACLVFTLSRGAWLGFIIGMLVFFLIYSRKTLSVILFGLFAVPLLPFVLPESIVKRFMSIGNLADSSTAYRVNIWRGSLNMIRECFWGGIGTGREAFTIVYPRFTLAGIESAPHSHNLYLQIIIELGIFGLIVFLAVIFFMTQYCFSFFAAEKMPDHDYEGMRLICAAGLSGTAAILAQGMTDYIWYNYRIFLIFWLVIGLAVAAARSAEALYSDHGCGGSLSYDNENISY